jgi:hydrogenase maturation protease
MSDRILVAGIGNIFLGDDAFGVEVVRRLAGAQLPDGVTVMDFGIRAYDLAFALMNEWDLTILVDALPHGGKPGTLYVMEPESPKPADQNALDAHSMNPVQVLQLVGAWGGKVGRLLIVGCEPASVEANPDGRMGLSASVEAALDEALRIVKGLVAIPDKTLAA